MISVLIIGNGNVASHLVKAFLKVDAFHVTQLNSRQLDNIPKATITILAVSDDAIAVVSAKVKNPLVVHTSGSFPLEGLKNTTRKGVFYMLQTFSKEKEVDFTTVPFCLEAENKEDYLLLETVAKAIGVKIYTINSEQRKALHVAAVFVNNFTNHLYKIGNDICEEHQVPFEILHPLIHETSEKIKTLSPEKAQTGPAIRHDDKTIENHLELLEKKQQTIYKLITQSIKNGN
ncbi:MAG: putative short-subunit dehydrogenase-like oxidoreductase (DUF2520 family) [Polaribacter sp.]|jgi:predicted short-subunit dehydrogenase-like oxidoreductase (DUF2520 family)